MDRVLRRTVRSFLNWPSDTPVEMFHAEENAGGLGIPLLKVCIPIMKEQRLARLARSNYEIMADVANTSYFQEQLRKVAKLRGKVKNLTPRDKKETRYALKEALHEKLDRKGLQAIQISGGHRVLTNGTLLTKGGNYIACMTIRGNLIATKSRIAKWQRPGHVL